MSTMMPCPVGSSKREAEPETGGRHGIGRLARHRVAGAAWRVLRVVLIVYLGIVLVFSFLQSWLIFPGRATRTAADAHVTRTPPGVELLEIPLAGGGGKIAAVFAPAQDADGRAVPDRDRRPTVVYFYGNASCMNYSWTEIAFFRRLGCNVLVPEFCGYGMSAGEASEANHYATADAAWAYVRSRPDVDRGRIVLAGWSLGAAPAIHLASRHGEAAGLVTMSAFTSMLDMARVAYPWLPSRAILKHHFKNERNMAHVRCPVLVVHGRRDSIVPVGMAEKLARAADGRARVLILDDADHNDVFDESPELRAGVKAFVDGLR